MLVHSRSARRQRESSKTGVTESAEKRNGWCGALTATIVAMNKERQTTFLLVRPAFRRYSWLRWVIRTRLPPTAVGVTYVQYARRNVLGISIFGYHTGTASDSMGYAGLARGGCGRDLLSLRHIQPSVTF